MDIAKYIALFLLKNKYCFLQGLGNVSIKKAPARHQNNELIPGEYVATLDPVGAIDDAFPNFVANNEQVSIAKASNEISVFIKESKAKLAAGGVVEIPSVGRYLLKEQKLVFELDANFSMSTPVMPFPLADSPKSTVSEVTTDESPAFEAYNNFAQQRAVNWNIVAFWGVVILIGGGIVVWAIQYFMAQQTNTEVVLETTTVPEPIIQPKSVDSVGASNGIDSAASNAAVVANPNDTPSYQFVVKTFTTFAKAEKKQKQLSSYGYNTSVVSKDSTTHYVVNTVKVLPQDTLYIIDSLTKMLNPSGVFILNP